MKETAPEKRIGMKTVFSWIVVSIFVAAMAVEGASAITGTIVSMNPDHNRLTLLQDGNMAPVTVNLARAWPPFVKVGVRATVIGGFAGNNSRVFNASSISPAPEQRQKNDPTGVRSRLFKRVR